MCSKLQLHGLKRLLVLPCFQNIVGLQLGLGSRRNDHSAFAGALHRLRLAVRAGSLKA